VIAWCSKSAPVCTGTTQKSRPAGSAMMAYPCRCSDHTRPKLQDALDLGRHVVGLDVEVDSRWRARAGALQLEAFPTR